MFFAPFPEEEILDYIAHGPIIRVLTVAQTLSFMLIKSEFGLESLVAV